MFYDMIGVNYQPQHKKGISQMASKTGGLQRPGQKPKGSGEYVERGPRGGDVKNPRQVTIEPGDSPLPPTQKPGHTWQKEPSKKK